MASRLLRVSSLMRSTVRRSSSYHHAPEPDVDISFALEGGKSMVNVTEISAGQRIAYYPKIGNRDVVARGFSAQADYFDSTQDPFPAIRFRNNTPEFMALREKEKGDWRNLTLEEKKSLYRHNFCSTISEIVANKIPFQIELTYFFVMLTVATAINFILKKYLYSKYTLHTTTDEWKHAMVQRIVAQHAASRSTVANKYDYEKKEWMDD